MSIALAPCILDRAMVCIHLFLSHQTRLASDALTPSVPHGGDDHLHTADSGYFFFYLGAY